MNNSGTKAIIFDFMRTLYDPESEALVPYAQEILDLANKGYDCFLVSKNGEGRDSLIDDLGLTSLFKKIFIVEKKTTDLFSEIVGSSYENVYVIGDRIEGEIQIGNQLGYTTIWFKNGKFKDRGPQEENEYPSHTVFALEEIKKII